MQTQWTALTNWFSGLSVEEIFSFKNLTSMTPPFEWKFMWIYVGILIFFWIGSIVSAFIKVHPSLKSRLSAFFWTYALLGSLLFVFRYFGIPLLGMDVWRTILEISAVVWAVSIVRYALRGLRQEKLAEKIEERRTKYLPKPKKKS
jgi:hypothetical protein